MGVKKYAKIIDKGECLSTINIPPGEQFIDWTGLEHIKHLAGASEWERHGFYPSNNLEGEIIGVVKNKLWRFDVYVLKIEDKFYVPMSLKGIKLI